MIPKIIHYCWFGGNPKTQKVKHCIASWKKYCNGWKIIEWNEQNCDIKAAPLYVQQAYELKKWAFVSDYFRLYIVEQYGGVYLDTDVEIVKSLDPLMVHHAFFGMEKPGRVATGLGFGAEKGEPILREMIKPYYTKAFLLDNNEMDLTPCWSYSVHAFESLGLKQEDTQQLLQGDILILPVRAMCPYDFDSGKMERTADTYSIHWYAASWHNKWFRFKKNVAWFIKARIGSDTYRSLKRKLHLR